MTALNQLNNRLKDRYVIEREIGRGGMATVYLAHDIRHDRHVALKVLDPELGAVVGKERFLAEIRVTAKLQHPHLLPLFDSGEADGQLFYVMPYVRGESLRDRLRRDKQLSIDEAVRITAAVGGALDYAHRHDVIHRDLKPENILLQDGHPLVADFGIALAVSVAGGARITQTGLSLGTPQYMSPEQATGDRSLDGRTDIYSLGAVLYEMLTGDPPHTGSTAQAVIAKVITERPQRVSLVRPTVTPQMEVAIDCALAKLPADRFATAEEFVDALRGKRAVAVPSGIITPASASSDVAIRARRTRRALRAAALVLIGFVGGALAMRLARERPRVAQPMRFQLREPDSIQFRNPPQVTMAISPDGSRVVWSARAGPTVRLYSRELNALESRPIPGTENADSPAFSPDGRELLYAAEGKLWHVPVSGGTPAMVVDSATNSYSLGADGVVLFYMPGRLYQTSINGGTPRLVAKAPTEKGIVTFSFPRLLPGNQTALVTLYKGSYSAGSARVGVVRLDDGEVIDLDMQGANPRYVAGHVLAARPNGSIVAAPFDAKRLRITGTPVSVLDNVTLRLGGSAEFDVSTNGTLVYRSGQVSRRLVSVDLRGIETPLLGAIREYSAPRWSPDGTRIAVVIPSTERRQDTWVFDTRSGALTLLTRAGGDRPEWSSDGKTIYTSHADSGRTRIMAQAWDASGEAVVFASLPQQNVAELSLPANGKGYLAARIGIPRRDIWIAPVDSPQALRPYIATAADESMPSVSTDGRWLSYVSNESGVQEVYVRPLPGPGGRIQISTDGGTQPKWGRNGEIFFRSAGKIVAARIANHQTTPSVSRRVLFNDVFVDAPIYRQFDVNADGTKFLFLRAAGPDPQTVVVLNWLTEMRSRMQRSEP